MSQNRRLLTYIAIALIVGAALALAVALASSGADTTGGAASGGVTAGSALYSDDGTTALAAADPAKEQPLLDKFTSKDPFIPFPTPGASSTSTASPSPSSTAEPTDLSANIKVDGTSYNVVPGDEVPGGSAAAFKVTSVTSSDVTFEVIDGELENGETSFSVNVGEAVRVTFVDSGVSYDISVVSIGSASTGGGSGGSSDDASHSITVLSISSQNGVAMATFEVDGQTYADKEVGDVFTTSWGEIEVLSINVGAQTVTILHGDQTLTLHAGQVVVK
ncbi:MAG: hypothetical protein ACM3MJ_09685 [Deltaproteobacteria bacterium]